MKSKTLRKGAFTLVEIMIVVAIIGLLAAIAIPNFVKARMAAQANGCINNLRQMDGAAQQWALENKKQSSDTVGSADISPYIRLDSGNNIPACPGGGTYTYGWTVAAHPTCSLSSQSPNPHQLP